MNSINVQQNKQNCCGCGACKNVCPKGCITMRQDDEGFEYPIVDGDSCINCGLCVKSCPYNFAFGRHEEIEKSISYAAQTKNEEYLSKSSSGGIFPELAEYFLKNNGIVYGAIYDKFDRRVKHTRADNLEGLKSQIKSKYLQSDTNDCYPLVKKDLEKGFRVLFSGTPCQVAGLYSFLGNMDSNGLTTVDIVCHGVPSKAVFDRYIKELENEKGAKVVSYTWRSKHSGWKPNTIEILLEDGTAIREDSQTNKFQKGFLHNLYLRPSCYDCPFPTLPRIADISLGDFWGYDIASKINNDNVGISMVIISSKKGARVLQEISERIILEKTSLEYAKEKSVHLWNSPRENLNRKRFFKGFLTGKAFSTFLFPKFLTSKSIRNENIRSGVKRTLRKLKPRKNKSV